jgi:hypothetical protein
MSGIRSSVREGGPQSHHRSDYLSLQFNPSPEPVQPADREWASFETGEDEMKECEHSPVKSKCPLCYDKGNVRSNDRLDREPRGWT